MSHFITFYASVYKNVNAVDYGNIGYNEFNIFYKLVILSIAID